MLEEGSAEGINVRVRIFNFTEGSQNARDGFKALICKITNVIVLYVSLSEWL